MLTDMVLLILGMGAVTYATRFTCLFLVGRYALPPRVARALAYIPIGILTAFVVPALFFPAPGAEGGGTHEMLWGGLASAAVAARWGHVLGAMVAGMAVVALLRWGIF